MAICCYPARSPFAGVSRVAPYLSQRHPSSFPLSSTGRFIATYIVGNGFKPFPTRDFGGPRKRDFGDSTCIWPFLSNLEKMAFPAAS